VFKYKRLSDISISHRYNLCKSKTYSRVRKHFKKTCAKRSSSGERRKLTMEISPGYIRIGRVRQGDQGSVKRRLSYQRVDEVTQFEVVCSAKKIREQQKPRGKPSCLTLDFLVSLESEAFNRNFIHPLFAPRGGE